MNTMHRLKGYTLIEMIVSVGIFSLVMLVASGAYVQLIGLDRQARTTNDLTTNLSFALESMSRSVRTGTGYSCSDTSATDRDANGNSTNGTCHQLSFTDTNLNQTVTYRRNSNGTVGECIGSGACDDSTAITLTDSRISVSATGLTFYVRGVGTGNGTQPQVTFTIKGTMVNDNLGHTSSFSVQSTATQRLNEIN